MALSDRDRRTVTIGGIAVGVLLAGFLVFSLLGGGEEPFPPIPETPPTAGSPTPPPGAGGPPIQSFTGRDPFSVPPALSPSPVPPPPGGTTTTPPPGGTTTTTPPPGGGTSTPPPAGGQNVGGSTVVLLDIFRRDGVTHAQVEVDGQVFDVTIGEAFGPNDQFELTSVSGNCATFLFGDERFTLCINPQK